MRIVHYLRAIRLEEGGIVRAVLDLATLTAASGHDVRVVTFDDADAPDGWRSDPAAPKVVRIDPPGAFLGRFARSQLARWREILHEADVLHLHAVWHAANSQLGLLADSMGLAYVVSVHGMLDDWCMSQRGIKKRAFLAAFARGTLERARFVHCTAGGELGQARKWFPRGRGVVIPLVFDLAPYRALPGPALAADRFGPGGTGDLASGEPIVLFLSRVHYKKGVDVLIRAIAELSRTGRTVRCIVAGTGDEAYLAQMRRLAASLGVKDRVRFVGMITGDLKLSLYQLADVFALPTSQENFGFVLPESLACGTPVVTTEGVDIWPELAEGGGAVIAPRTPEAFAREIASLLDDPAKRATMGERGREWVMRYLDGQSVAARYEDLYRRAKSGADSPADA
ncbi:MAG: glycosyltransferase [Phycisphaeraceae bacterium]|nr:glycosyltransferase [Phycisphaeraceae bacterium]